MRHNRVYVEAPLAAGSRARIEGSAANHVLRVLRLAPGDPLTVFDGRGGEHAARIGGLDKSGVTIEVGEHRPVERESPLEVTLAQGVSRGERMDLVVQKATELGVRRIVPVLTERTVVRVDAKQRAARLHHWQGVAVAACEQCGRNTVPRIGPPVTVSELLSAGDDGSLRLVLTPGGEASVRDLTAGPGGVTLLIGPEGGLSQDEHQAAIRAGYRPLGLGPRVLRTETAAIAAIAAIQLQLGDL
jgi:16S rRNA (uracil1498-N3)-methyltransferase